LGIDFEPGNGRRFCTKVSLAIRGRLGVVLGVLCMIDLRKKLVKYYKHTNSEDEGESRNTKSKKVAGM